MRKLLSFFLCLVMLLALPLTASAEPSPPPFELTVLVEGGNDTTVRAYQDSYRGNLYLSMIDLSQALNGTAGQFRINYTWSAIHGEGFQVLKGEAAGPASSSNLPPKTRPNSPATRTPTPSSANTMLTSKPPTLPRPSPKAPESSPSLERIGNSRRTQAALGGEGRTLCGVAQRS